MATKRFIKAGLRLLRFKAPAELGNYEFLTYPITTSPKELEQAKFIAVLVVFFEEKELEALSKSLDEYWSANPDRQFAVITIFSDTRYLKDLHERHANKKLTIYNIFCISDVDKLKYCLKKNCQIEAAKITEEIYYQNSILQTAKKYQKKHSCQQEDQEIDDAPIEESSEKEKTQINGANW